MSVTSAARADAVGLRIPIGLALGVIVAGAAVVHAVLALSSPSPWIVPDEIIYSELAKSIGSGHLPSIRGEVSFDYGLGYPLLLAPVWASIENVPTAYAVAKVLNAFVMSAAAVPTYFLARRFVSQGYGLVAAVLSVSVPSLLYSGTLMTEVALYPTFILALLAMTVAMERATVTPQLLAVAAILVACAVKTVCVVLLVAYPLAIALFTWLDARGRVWLGRFTPTWISLAVLALAALAMALVAGHPPYAVLGTYSSVIEHMRPADVPGWILAHAGELILAAGVIPVVATILVAVRGCRRPAPVNERLFVAVFVPITGCWLAAVGAFASVPFLTSFEYPENVQRLQGRSTFMLAPLFFIGLVMWLGDRRGGMALVAALAAVTAVLPVAIPFQDLEGHVRFQALGLVPWVALRDEIAWPVGMLLFTCALGLLFVMAFRIRASALLFLVPVVAVLGTLGLTAHLSMRWASEGARSVTAGAAVNWVDSAVGGGDDVSVLWAEPPGREFSELYPRQYVVFVGEFFNRTMGEVYEIGTPLPYKLPSTKVRVRDGHLLMENGHPVGLGEFVLAPCHVRVVGVPIARDQGTGARVYRVTAPVRVSVASPTSCRSPRTS